MRRTRGVRGTAIAAILGSTVAAYGQMDVDQFGGQSRADAARDLIVLAVQQGISSLPPTSGQSFIYEYNTELGAFEPAGQLGPTAFRSPLTIGKNRVSVRAAGSYFGLSESFGPTSYLLQADEAPDLAGLTRFGLDASAKVGLINLGASYGILDGLEVMLNVPVAVVSAQASQVSSVVYSDRNLPAIDAPLGFVGPLPLTPDRTRTINALERGFNNALAPPFGPCDPGPDPEQCLTYRTDSVSSLGFDFNDGTQAGVGRIDLGFKWTALENEYAQVALSLETFFASPNQAQFSGSDSYSLLPRVIARVPLPTTPAIHLLADAGYEYDFSVAELRRFVWNAGISVPFRRFSFDLGVGGSVFDEGIQWSPSSASIFDENNQPVGTITALGDTRLGTTFVDFIGGLKFAVTDHVVLSGTVNVPVNDEGFRADAVGTVAAEYYF